MLRECLEVFEYMLTREGESLVLDSYVPADGTYILVGRDGSQKAVMDVRMDKKTKKVDHSHPFFEEFCFCDYHSQLLSMNKPVDGPIMTLRCHAAISSDLFPVGVTSLPNATSGPNIPKAPAKIMFMPRNCVPPTVLA